MKLFLVAVFLALCPVLKAQVRFEQVHQRGGDLVFEFPSDTASVYVLDETASLSELWREGRLVSGNGAPVQITNSITGQTRFIRARSFPRTFISKPGSPMAANFALSNSISPQWSVSGELPAGIVFASGAFSGTPAADAAEKVTSGDYTNVMQLTTASGTSSAEIVNHVRLSYSRNIFPQRPNGPSFGTICLECHGSGFPPDFMPSPAPLLTQKSGSAGDCPNTWNYIVPGDLAKSLIYQKVTIPPCGERMPYGGPYLNERQINRLARWISELKPGDLD